jgi:hypothetical protein
MIHASERADSFVEGHEDRHRSGLVVFALAACGALFARRSAEREGPGRYWQVKGRNAKSEAVCTECRFAEVAVCEQMVTASPAAACMHAESSFL